MTNSAWLARSSVKPSTSSPWTNASTSGPTCATTPARSLPCPDGNRAGHWSPSAPERILASPGLMPAAFTATRTAAAAGVSRVRGGYALSSPDAEAADDVVGTPDRLRDDDGPVSRNLLRGHSGTTVSEVMVGFYREQVLPRFQDKVMARKPNRAVR